MTDFELVDEPADNLPPKSARQLLREWTESNGSSGWLLANAETIMDQLDSLSVSEAALIARRSNLDQALRKVTKERDQLRDALLMAGRLAGVIHD